MQVFPIKHNCSKCGAKSAYKDEEGDVRCLSCDRIQTKSDILRQMPGCIDLPTIRMDPVDLRGLPIIG